jgi:hypothetical protein
LPGPCDIGTGVYVVFTAIEVAEKQGRHWVRLPFVCKMRVAESVAAEELVPDSNRDSSEQLAVVGGQDARAVLVAVPGRVLEGMNRRNYDFDDYCDLLDLQAHWLDAVFEGNAIEVKSRWLSGEKRIPESFREKSGGGASGHPEQSGCGYRGDGVLVRAGP